MMKSGSIPLLILLLPPFHISCSEDRNIHGIFENAAATRGLFSLETTQLLPSLLSLQTLLRNKLGLGNASLDHPSLKSIQEGMTTIEKVTSGMMSSSDFPTFELDYKGALRGLMILVETYDLNLKDLIQGRISARNEQFDTRHSLGAVDLINLSKEAYAYKWYDTAILFLKEALTIHDLNPGSLPKQQYKQVQQFKNTLVNFHNQMLKKKKKRWGEGFKLLPYLVDDNLERSKKQPKFVHTLGFSRNGTNQDDIEMQGNEKLDEAGRRICRHELTGQHVRTQQPRLHCHLLHQEDPYLRLGPFKIENLLAVPVRLIIHDFLDEAEIQWLVEYSEPLMSKIRQEGKEYKSTKNVINQKSIKVTSQTLHTYIKMVKYEEEAKYDRKTGLQPLKDPYTMTVTHPVLYKLARKIEIATRLKVRGRFSAEDFQVTSYGLSGLFESHIDPHEIGGELPPNFEHIKSTGDYFYTMQAWLNDVEAGGATIFDRPDFEQSVWPTRGSLLVWANLDKKGNIDYKTSHAGCPILKGTKWIVNKWTYYYDQFQEYPCGLRPWEHHGEFTRRY